MCKSNIRNWQGLLKLWTLSFLLLGFIGIFTSQNTHATTGAESVALTVLPTGSDADNTNLAVQILQLFQSPVTGGELSEYGPIGATLSSIASVLLGAAMSTNLFMVSGDWSKAIPAMFGTFFLASENVFRVLQAGTYRRFYHRYKCEGGACPNGQQWVDLVITLTAVGAGVIIAVADADSAGTGMATLCKGFDEKNKTKTDNFNSTYCTSFDNGYYEDCILPGTGNQTELASEPYGTCEKGLYGLGVTINGIPTAVVGGTAMYGVFMYLKALGYNTATAFSTLWKGATEIPRYGLWFISKAGEQAMSLKDGVSTALKQFPITDSTTFLAQKFRPSFKPEVAYQAIEHATTNELVTSNALFGAASGVGQVIVLAAVSFVGISTLTDVFNSGKNLDYIKRNGFNLIPKEGGSYVVQFPNGTVVDPEHPDYEINKAFVQSFKDNMESADGAMIRSQMTYYAQSIMVGLAGVIGPYLTVKGLGYVLYKTKLRELPMENLYFPSLLLSLAMTSTGFHFYGKNLDASEDSIKQLTAYRKATGEDSYVDYMLTPWQKVQLSKTLLAGVFTVIGAVAIQPYVSLGMRKIVNIFLYIKLM